MTEEQKLLIKKLRYEGIGYKAIGLQLGLSRDVVRNFCKEWMATANELNSQGKWKKNLMSADCAGNQYFKMPLEDRGGIAVNSTGESGGS